MLSDRHKSVLLRLARSAIRDILYEGISGPGRPDDKIFDSKVGVFVTLSLDGALRGCIGYITGVEPLWDAVRRMAEEAAFGDPRFPSLSADEFDRVRIEISVLSPLEGPLAPESDFSGYGIYIRRGGRSGLLLPQVALEYGWDSHTFLEHTCLKAGLPGDCHMQSDTEIYRFEAEIFSEGE